MSVADVTVEAPTKPAVRRRGWKILRALALCVGFFVLLLLTLWAAAALYFDLAKGSLRVPAAIAYVVGVICLWIFVKPRKLAFLLTIVAFALVLILWFRLAPSNFRPWQPDVAVLPSATFDGDQVTIRNIRNCLYRSETDYDVRHYDKTFDLTKLRSVDLYFVYWGSPSIAHTMVSFGFEGDDYVCISIETRKEKGEGYSALRGFFRQFEITYVIADERDLVRLRTDFRKEQVYLYRILMPRERARAILMSYLNTANQLTWQPQWYNALTHNCTTIVKVHADHSRTEAAPFDWRVIINGYGDEMLYERRRIDTSLPFAELKKRSLVNARATAASDENFSRAIRETLPGMTP